MQSNFEEDFPAISFKRKSRKLQRRKEKDELNKAAELMSGRTYQIMVSALEDLVSSKKGLLMAFRLWKKAVDIEKDCSSDIAGIADVNIAAGGERSITTNADEENSIYTR